MNRHSPVQKMEGRKWGSVASPSSSSSSLSSAVGTDSASSWEERGREIAAASENKEDGRRLPRSSRYISQSVF